MSTYVLIHGGWHGGWCWRKVADRLRKLGHVVFTPTLTGMGEREHLWTPDVGLVTHTQDILNLIRFEQLSHAILVGHSYGGAIMTLAADQMAPAIDALVYVDALRKDKRTCSLALNNSVAFASPRPIRRCGASRARTMSRGCARVVHPTRSKQCSMPRG
jgi:pimeloyl-ACP methyl ester carboxylesterase